MILPTIHLAAWADPSGDPWRVLGNSGFARLAIAGLADLALARRLAVAPAADDEGPGGRRLSLVPGPPVGGLTAFVEQTLAGVTKQLDVDRAVRSLRASCASWPDGTTIGATRAELGPPVEVDPKSIPRLSCRLCYFEVL